MGAGTACLDPTSKGVYVHEGLWSFKTEKSWLKFAFLGSSVTYLLEQAHREYLTPPPPGDIYSFRVWARPLIHLWYMVPGHELWVVMTALIGQVRSPGRYMTLTCWLWGWELVKKKKIQRKMGLIEGSPGLDWWAAVGFPSRDLTSKPIETTKQRYSSVQCGQRHCWERAIVTLMLHCGYLPWFGKGFVSSFLTVPFLIFYSQVSKIRLLISERWSHA